MENIISICHNLIFLIYVIISHTHAHASSLIFSSILSSALVTLSWLTFASWWMEAFSVKSEERVVTKSLLAAMNSSGYRLNESRLCMWMERNSKLIMSIHGSKSGKIKETANLVNSPRYRPFPKCRPPSSTADSAVPSSTRCRLRWCWWWCWSSLVESPRCTLPKFDSKRQQGGRKRWRYRRERYRRAAM